tara:strand:- start:32 stop:250 length:219 start_codon:yes stop_codon:yes gene_type:complete
VTESWITSLFFKPQKAQDAQKSVGIGGIFVGEIAPFVFMKFVRIASGAIWLYLDGWKMRIDLWSLLDVLSGG